ncbi:MAG TPA: 16S rRNA (guanine(527)-N(7))-methyltransferase RsmG [Solirubrobacteraceae bacterium]|nr:16S rRNA (guanine(527)-N(7))-methyltransferase RsmG [Solirubrobacteraceae bacterium]
MPDPPSVAALAARYGLTDDTVPRLHALVELVATDPAAPTTVTDRPGILRDHLADSLVALVLETVRGARVIADLGAGAGFPGLPLAIALPQAEVSLVESNGRKCEFMTRAAAVCEAGNARVVEARAESWTGGLDHCDVVVARALAPLAVVAEYAGPLLRLGGTLVAWRGRRDPHEEAQGARAAGQLGLEPADPLRVEPYEGALNRHLHVMVKVAVTPPRFPRRPGMARKRPLN